MIPERPIRTPRQAIANLARSAAEGSNDVENLLIEKSPKVISFGAEVPATGRSAKGGSKTKSTQTIEGNSVGYAPESHGFHRRPLTLSSAVFQMIRCCAREDIPSKI